MITWLLLLAGLKGHNGTIKLLEKNAWHISIDYYLTESALSKFSTRWILWVMWYDRFYMVQYGNKFWPVIKKW